MPRKEYIIFRLMIKQETKFEGTASAYTTQNRFKYIIIPSQSLFTKDKTLSLHHLCLLLRRAVTAQAPKAGRVGVHFAKARQYYQSQAFKYRSQLAFVCLFNRNF